jgi:hypothetical protein
MPASHASTKSGASPGVDRDGHAGRHSLQKDNAVLVAAQTNKSIFHADPNDMSS